jgi:hypothetical protein
VSGLWRGSSGRGGTVATLPCDMGVGSSVCTLSVWADGWRGRG